MIKYLVLSIGLIAFTSMAYAEVTAMNNNELAAVVVAPQEQFLQPVLPEYQANVQIGGVVGATPNVPVTMMGQLGNPTETPSASFNGNSGGLKLMIPVSQLADRLANLPNLNINIPVNTGR